ncbi:MAG TPA: alpha/beta fold hydrolase [Burkholderiales bacterium]|nr:alpha/beta fold hydrolase [Burkholderiales bacterium]
MQKNISDAERSACRTVVVVHGLWMTGAVFALLRLRLARFGYRVAAFSYPSTRLTLDEIASRLARFVSLLGAARVDFVGHSLGGLAVLNMLAAHPRAPAGRVVLLGTPVTGSRAAQRIAKHGHARTLIGTALLDWSADRGAAVAARSEVGMIAGTVRFGLGSLFIELPVPNDGAVCVDETRMPGLRDHLCLPLSHSGMMLSGRVAHEIRSFLELGHFTRG